MLIILISLFSPLVVNSLKLTVSLFHWSNLNAYSVKGLFTPLKDTFRVVD